MPVQRIVTLARLIAAVLWTLVILGLCLLPGLWVNAVEKKSGIWIPNLDKLVHCGIFVLFSIFWIRLGSSTRRYIWVALAGIALGAGTELLQNLPIVGRDCNLLDALTDAAGVLVGLAAAPFVEPLIRFVESRLFRDITVPGTTLEDGASKMQSPNQSAS